MQAEGVQPPLVLDRADLERLMSLEDHYGAAQAAFRAHARGATSLPLPLHIQAGGGGFHAKGALVELERAWVAVKVNSNFPANPLRGLPTIQGRVLLFDAMDGTLLAILDSIEITAKRTAAATALAAVHLARRDADTLAVLGCGEQGRAQLAALAGVLPLRRVLAWDIDAGRARDYAARMAQVTGAIITPCETLEAATLQARVIVTATSAREPFLEPGHVRPGTFIAAVGADSPHKNEVQPELFRNAKIVVDSLEQAALMGDLHHAIEAGVASRQAVHAQLAEVVAGSKPGRTDDEEITLFDSTGLAIQDVAAAAAAWERAISPPAG